MKVKGDGGLSIIGVATCLLLFIFGYYVGGRKPDTVEQSHSNNLEPLYTISTMSLKPVVPAVARKMGQQRRSPTALSAFSKQPPVPEENFNKNFFFDIFKKEEQSGGGGGGKGSGFYSFSANDIDGKKVDFSKYKGKVSLVVNVASE